MHSRLIVILFLPFIFLGCITTTAGAVAGRPKVAAIPFTATSLQAMAFTENISSSLFHSLDRTGLLELIERKKIEQFLELEGLRLDTVTFTAGIKLAARAGVDYLLFGTVAVIQNGSALDITVVSVRSEKVVTKETVILSEADFSKKLADVATTIAGRITTPDSLPAASSSKLASLAAPAALEASGTTTSIRLRWKYSQPDAVAGFNIFRSGSQDGQYSLVATASCAEFVDENLKLNEVFYYKVAAAGKNGESGEQTPPVRGATSVAPSVPILMNTEPDLKAVRLVWQARPGSANDERMRPDGFRIYRSTTANGSFSGAGTAPATSTTYTDTGCEEGKICYYKITAFNRDKAESDYSSSLAGSPLPLPRPVRATGKKIRQALISWDRYPSEEFDGYKVYRALSSNGPFKDEVTRISGKDTLEYLDKNLGDATSYWYRLSVFRTSGGESGLSDPVLAVTRELPMAPVGLTAAEGLPRKGVIRWKSEAKPEDELVKYFVFRTEGRADSPFVKTAEVSSAIYEYVDNDPPLKDKTQYFYKVRAVNSGDAQSLDSATVSLTTKAAPEVPSGVSAVSGETRQVTIVWTKNSEPDIKAYRVAIKRAGGSEFTKLAEVSEARYVDSGLNVDEEHSYQVQAVDRDGLESPPSPVVTARTRPLPSRITGLRLSDPAGRVISWQAGTGQGTRTYNIYKASFLGNSQKLATVTTAEWKCSESGKLELYVTAVDEAGLESLPSEPIRLE
jgi:uncharacterized protein